MGEYEAGEEELEQIRSVFSRMMIRWEHRWKDLAEVKLQ